MEIFFFNALLLNPITVAQLHSTLEIQHYTVNQCLPAIFWHGFIKDTNINHYYTLSKTYFNYFSLELHIYLYNLQNLIKLNLNNEKNENASVKICISSKQFLCCHWEHSKQRN